MVPEASLRANIDETAPTLGYDLSERGGALMVNEDEGAPVRAIFDLYLEHGSLIPVVQGPNRCGWRMKEWTTRKGKVAGGQPFAKNRLYNLPTNMVYFGKVEYGGQVYEGEYEAIVDGEVSYPDAGYGSKETVRVVVENPRAVQWATMTAAKQNVGRREMASLQLSPGLLTS